MRPPTNTSARHGSSDGRPFKPQDKGQLCSNCQKWDHLRAVCPDRNVSTVSRDDQKNISPIPTFIPKRFQVGSIFGKPVQFLLDSRADHSLINSNLVQQFKQCNLPVPALSRSIMTRCFQGRSESNQIVVLPCLLSGSEVSVNMAVTDKLDRDAFLDRDFRNIREFIHQATATNPLEVLAIQTSARPRQKLDKTLLIKQIRLKNGLNPISLRIC